MGKVATSTGVVKACTRRQDGQYLVVLNKGAHGISSHPINIGTHVTVRDGRVEGAA